MTLAMWVAGKNSALLLISAGGIYAVVSWGFELKPGGLPVIPSNRHHAGGYVSP